MVGEYVFFFTQLKGTSAHLHALKLQLNEARFQAYAPTNGKGKNSYQLSEPVCGSQISVIRWLRSASVAILL
jgi:hypothetical protein